MLSGALVRRIQFLILFCSVVVTLVITPWVNLDPINIPKLLVLSTCGFVAAGCLVPFWNRLFGVEARKQTLVVLFFAVTLFLVFFASESSKSAQIYGTFGRNTGLLAYLSLAILFYWTSFVSDSIFLRKLILMLIASGFLNAIYGMIQVFGLDPIKWESTYKPIIGTLGNPNFLSALLGMSGTALLALSLDKSRGALVRCALLASMSLMVFVMYHSKSSQGLFILALVAPIIFYLRFRVVWVKMIRNVFWLVLTTSFLFGLSGILNRGPLAPFLYQDSITFRGDYWRAGWKMTLSHPFFGVGLDSYGDWYRFSRTEAAAIRRGPDVTSNSAHNVFLDISSNGGFLMLLAYLLIIGLVVRSGWRVLQKSAAYDAFGVGLVSAWVAYTVQSLISINQLGIAIWGWVLGGAIIGYDSHTENMKRTQSKLNKKKQIMEQVPAAIVLTGSLGLIIGFVVSIWPMAQDVAFKRALESGDGVKVELATRVFPRNYYYYLLASQVFLDNKFNNKSLTLARLAIAENPRDFNSWKMLAANPQLSADEKASAIAKMRELDPFNNTLDKQ